MFHPTVKLIANANRRIHRTQGRTDRRVRHVFVKRGANLGAMTRSSPLRTMR
jgi:hypothetical protein